jgi:hypothetical protein
MLNKLLENVAQFELGKTVNNLKLYSVINCWRAEI